MSMEQRIKFLRIALIVFGLIFIVGIFGMMKIWPSGWTWEPRQSEYELMIMGIYATLGVFLLIASKNPMAHKSLIWFTVWSSLIHGAIMAYQAIVDSAERANFLGDIPALFLVAIVLAVLMPRGKSQNQ